MSFQMIISCNQSAYKHGYLTETALLSKNKVILALANDESTALFFLYQSAAIDTTDHSTLMVLVLEVWF